jgi:hypothetical protein
MLKYRNGLASRAKHLGAWLKLAKNTNDNNAWEAVGRLAESLLDDEALLQYQRRLLALNPNNEAAFLN